MTQYDYTKTPCAIDSLTQEIQNSLIITALDHINLLGSSLSIFFKADLSNDDIAILDSVVSVHAGTPLIQNQVTNVAVQSQPAVSIISQPPFSAKTTIINGVTKKLYARTTGFQQALTSGANTITYTATYTQAKLVGAEIINCEALDFLDFKVYDDSNGTYSGYPNLLLNQFGYSVNLPKDFYQRISPFDADVYSGMVLKVTYNSISNKTIGINLIINEVK